MTVLKLKIRSVVSVLMVYATASMAVTQGEMGASSTGAIAISLTTEDQIKVSNLTDIRLSENENGDYTGSSPACIFRNGTGSYSITVYGSGAGHSFTLSNGGTSILTYRITFDDGTGAQSLISNSVLSGRTHADTRSKFCANGNNAKINISIADSAPIPGETYSGILTLTVSPE